MTFSALSHLECPRCGATHDADQIIGLCPCGSPLLARYDVLALHKDDLVSRGPDLWRYHELLPVRSPENVVTLGEGMTPLLPLPRYGAELGVDRLLMKDEGLIPTGTFKARGAAVGVSRAYEVGVRKIAMPTNGNAGSAWAAYAARAGMEALIAMPIAAPEICRREVTAVGARLQLIDGLIGDAAAYVRSLIQDQPGYFDASTLKEPYRIEGKKTMGLEIAEQLNWQLPDVIVYPTGGGVGIIGIWKALNELRDLGWIEGPLPRLVAVQSTGCAPIVRAWEKGLPESEPWPDARTVAFGITVPKALGDFLVLQAIAETGGCAIAVDDEDILAEQHQVAQLEGTFICPEGAANFAAIRSLRDSGWIHADDQVVALNTGAGLKYPETVPI
ncbi:threonine synthase [Kribbella sp. VKM Ac-2571]|uniref:threonine synthase n=1 Tax=Kribbella sp. VKM Ac-2571 TaxID=2512222 RepID=UPI00106233AD|nr:threonine synthase [Kribbella sp. VKM Ac-2571]TDO46582.1 threonine synthase [Kribbella sp. VKM Ac-2571]